MPKAWVIGFHCYWQFDLGTSKYVGCYKCTTPISTSGLSMERPYCTKRQVLAMTSTGISSKLCACYWTKVQMSMHETMPDAHPCTTRRFVRESRGYLQLPVRWWKAHAFCLSMARIYEPRTTGVRPRSN